MSGQSANSFKGKTEEAHLGFPDIIHKFLQRIPLEDCLLAARLL